MVKATRLKAWHLGSAYAAIAAFPECHPFLDRVAVVSRCTEKMDVIWHEYVGTDQPCVRLTKCLERRFMNVKIG